MSGGMKHSKILYAIALMLAIASCSSRNDETDVCDAVYVFFMVFLIPLVPLKCYLVSAPDKDWRYEVHRELEINGYEAAGIMLKIYMGISLTLGMVLIIVALLLK